LQYDFFSSPPTSPSLSFYFEAIARYLAALLSPPATSPPHRYDSTILGNIDNEAIE